MIHGYNTDVEYDGVVYHVQTEDKGLESPLILSLVYSGGEILASKRSPYEDLIASGYSDEALAERLKRQHRLICAAIHNGRIEELKRMGQAGLLTLNQGVLEEASGEEAAEAQPPTEAPSVVSPPPPPPPPPPSPPPPAARPPEVFTVHDHRRESPLGELPVTTEGLRVSLLDDQEFRSGDSLSLRILVSYSANNQEKPVNDAAVSVKVLGTSFRPQIYSVKTQRDGVANVSAQIPEFTSGRAAILIRVTAGDDETEIRRVIHSG